MVPCGRRVRCGGRKEEFFAVRRTDPRGVSVIGARAQAQVVARMCRCHEPPLSVCLRLLSLRRTFQLGKVSLQSSNRRPAVLLPESFRGGCSFGTGVNRFLPAGMRPLSGWTLAWQEAKVVAGQIIVAPAVVFRIVAATCRPTADAGARHLRRIKERCAACR